MDTPSARKTVGGALAHHYRLLCVVVLVVTGAAAAAAVVRPPTYQATAVLDLDESPNVNGGFDLAVQADQFLSQRYIQMATSRELLEQVCSGSAIRCSAASLAKQVSATTSKTSGTIQVSVNAGSRFEAAELANGVANKVVEENRAEIAAAAASARAYLQNELQRQSAQIAAVQASLRAAQVPGRTEATVANASAPLLSDLNAAQAQYTAAYTRLTDLDV